MATTRSAVYEKYWSVILRAGQASTRDELLSIVRPEADILDEGALATMRLLADGEIEMENAFTTLDCAKGIASKNLLIRAAAKRGGKEFTTIFGRPDPGHVAYFLKGTHQRTAIVALHMMGRNRLAILVAANAPTGSGIRGFGDVYYDCVWLDGIRDENADALEQYAVSVSRGRPDHAITSQLMEFLSAIIFHLLQRPAPSEVIFIPHKLLHALPLHAIWREHDGKRLYLHDHVQSIRYASSFHELANAGISFVDGSALRNRTPRYLAVFDMHANLPAIALEQKWVNVYRQQTQGLTFDIATRMAELPADRRDCLWVSWSSHAHSNSSSWGDSYLTLGDDRIDAATIAADWQFDFRPTVVLAACTTAIDTSGALHIDEYCGLDLAFRIAGAEAAVASLWALSDPLAALVAILLPSLRFQNGMPAHEALTALQRAFCGGTWKDSYLFGDEQLRGFPAHIVSAIREAQAPFEQLRPDAFADESAWAALRCHG